jgi:CBS domain containing-hemolysin-like protein
MKYIVINIIGLILTIILSIASQVSHPSTTLIQAFEDLGTYEYEALVAGLSIYAIYISIFLEEVYIRKYSTSFSFWRSLLIFTVSIIFLTIFPLYLAGGSSLAIVCWVIALFFVLIYLIIRKILDQIFPTFYNYIEKYYIFFSFFLIIASIGIFYINYEWWF